MIKIDMEMPSSCFNCPFSIQKYTKGLNDYSFTCLALNREFSANDFSGKVRLDECPLCPETGNNTDMEMPKACFECPWDGDVVQIDAKRLTKTAADDKADSRMGRHGNTGEGVETMSKWIKCSEHLPEITIEAQQQAPNSVIWHYSKPMLVCGYGVYKSDGIFYGTTVFFKSSFSRPNGEKETFQGWGDVIGDRGEQIVEILAWMPIEPFEGVSE